VPHECSSGLLREPISRILPIILPATISTPLYRFHDATERAFRLLAEYPAAGPRRLSRHPDLQGMRSWPITGFRNYLVFYRTVETDIEIVRVLHGARDVEQVVGNG